MSDALGPRLRLPAGPVDLAQVPTDARLGFDGDKAEARRALADLGPGLADLQERLFAESTAGGTRAVLLVLQGMDTSGKGGVVRHTVGLVDPQGVDITAFKAPTPQEREHDFLWRIRRGLPGPGRIGVFDRSHYEDVLVARVRGLADPAVIERRYDEINAFEAEVAASGTRILKVMLHISAATQKERLLERLERGDKHWKFDPGDIDERQRWSEYRSAYQIALERTNTEAAPWHVVPADTKWYRNLAVGRLLHETLTQLDPQWPVAGFAVEEQRRRLETEDPIA